MAPRPASCGSAATGNGRGLALITTPV